MSSGLPDPRIAGDSAGGSAGDKASVLPGFRYAFLLGAVVVAAAFVLHSTGVIHGDFTVWVFGMGLALAVATLATPVGAFGRSGLLVKSLCTFSLLCGLGSSWMNDPDIKVWPVVAVSMLAVMLACIVAGSFLDRRRQHRAAAR